MTVEDVGRLAARCDELELSIEWIGERTPSLAHAVGAAGPAVERHALLVLDAGALRPVAPPQDATIELLTADDSRLVTAPGAAEVFFGAGGTGVGVGGPAARDERIARIGDDMKAHLRRRTAVELTLTPVAAHPADGVLAADPCSPPATPPRSLPWRRCPHIGAAAVTTALVHEAEPARSPSCCSRPGTTRWRASTSASASGASAPHLAAERAAR